MVIKYPIQERWPYRQPLHRVMSTKETMRWLFYMFLFENSSADYIRTYVAYIRFSA